MQLFAMALTANSDKTEQEWLQILSENSDEEKDHKKKD